MVGASALAIPESNNEIAIFHDVVISDKIGAFSIFFQSGRNFESINKRMLRYLLLPH
jgi:hypothetical protein